MSTLWVPSRGSARSGATRWVIRYSGDSGAVTVRSLWQEEGGRPVIVSVEPVG